MPRRRETLDDALFREALRQWIDWLAAYYGPTKQRAGAGPDAGSVYDAAARTLRRSDEHADPTCGRLLSEEFLRLDWPASIHAIILDMPREWRLCLLGTALEYSQASIGREIGVRQQVVSLVLGQARGLLLQRLRLLARTRRELGGLGWERAA